MPWTDTVVPGTHLLRGEITTIDFTTREFSADGRDYRSFDVHLDLVSKNDQMSPGVAGLRGGGAAHRRRHGQRPVHAARRPAAAHRPGRRRRRRGATA
ncbi:hypothetical protein V2I01_32400 [Micromonospora sp. BRA006-A]|nr:hypothetical protein [Micromonospora sp. BRA006-A]